MHFPPLPFLCLLVVNQVVQHRFLRAVLQVVHQPRPTLGIGGFKFLRHALVLRHLRHQPRHHLLRRRLDLR